MSKKVMGDTYKMLLSLETGQGGVPVKLHHHFKRRSRVPVSLSLNKSLNELFIEMNKKNKGNEVQGIRVTVDKKYPENRVNLKKLLTVVAERSLFYFDNSEMADNDPDDYIRLALNDTVEDYRLYMQSKDERLKTTSSLKLIEGSEIKNEKSMYNLNFNQNEKIK